MGLMAEHTPAVSCAHSVSATMGHDAELRVHGLARDAPTDDLVTGCEPTLQEASGAALGSALALLIHLTVFGRERQCQSVTSFSKCEASRPVLYALGIGPGAFAWGQPHL